MESPLDYLPEFLLGATFLTGVIWFIDVLRWRPARLAAAAELEARTAESEQDGEAYLAARETLLRDPPIVEWGGSFFPVLAVVLVLRSFLYEPFVIPSESMLPTLEKGDYILVNKFAFGLRFPVFGTKLVDVGSPQRGDVMVFFPPGRRSAFIKRVVGLPGDVVRYEGKRLFVNDEAAPIEVTGPTLRRAGPHGEDVRQLTERLGDVDHAVHQFIGVDSRSAGTWTVPAGHYFMMGDNRDNSSDSRLCFGNCALGGARFVPEENIVGKAFYVWMQKEPGLALPSFENNRRIR